MASSSSTGIKKLQEENINIKKNGNLATIQGTVSPIKKIKNLIFYIGVEIYVDQKIHLIVMEYIILK